MLLTNYGAFDGDTWEALCQLIFKAKYGHRHYQEMLASPGDYGVEGFTKSDGTAFQCYCPDRNYTQPELYDKQRDKITTDLGKLKTYEKALKERLGSTIIKEWIFVTPIITHNKLLAHAQSKQDEVLSWQLSIIDPNFTVILHDADFYASEIHAIKRAQGSKLTFISSPNISKPRKGTQTEYEGNISRKNKFRCTTDGQLDSDKHSRLNRLTTDKWLDSDRLLKGIERTSPDTYFHLTRVVTQYENELEELCLTWQGHAEELISKVKTELSLRIKEELPDLGDTERYRITDQITSTWIALCPLGFE